MPEPKFITAEVLTVHYPNLFECNKLSLSIKFPSRAHLHNSVHITLRARLRLQTRVFIENLMLKCSYSSGCPSVLE